MDGRRSYSDDSDNRWYPSSRGYEESDEFAPPRDGSGSYSRDTSGSYQGASRGRRAAAERTGAPLFTPEEEARLNAAQAAMTQTGGGRSATYASGTGPIIGVPAGPPPAGMNPPAPGTYGGGYTPHIPTQGGEQHAPVSAAPTDLTAPHEMVAGDLALSRQPAAPPRPATETVYRARRPGAAILLIVIAVVAGLLFFRGLAISAFGDHFLLPGVIAAVLALCSLPLLVLGLYALVTGAAHNAEQYGFKIWAKPPLAYLLVGLVLILAAALALG